jgi:mono/diheme cytochrome c family protein
LLLASAVAWTACLLGNIALHAQASRQVSTHSRTGLELYEAACAACHGTDGTGQPQARVGFDTPLPDFTDCGYATPEQDSDWLAIVAHGGPVRAFDRRMPAFGEALSDEDILKILGHIRTFCANRTWPRGELNLPRPLLTEKAFPENEAVWMVGADRDHIRNEFVYERRFGSRNQFEAVLPFEMQGVNGGGWHRGLGDLTLAVKRVMFHGLERGSIVSAGTELSVPTGKESTGLGKGFSVIEPFVALGQILPSNGFLHVHAGLEAPVGRTGAANEAFWRAAAGKSFFERGVGRSWSPMIEVLGVRELTDRTATEWDIVPQMQVTLSKRQHVMVSAGIRIPLNEREERHSELVTYLLWDWFDGGFLSGWR